MVDSIGKTMELLSSETVDGKKFLPDLLENKQGYGVSAQYKSPDTSEVRLLTIEPTSISGSFDIVKGAEVDRIIDDPVYEKLIKIANKARKEYNITTLSRSGLRLFFLDHIDVENNLNQFKTLIRESYISDIENVLGDMTDSGVVFEGEHADRIKYRAAFGPYFKHEAIKYFPNTHASLSNTDNFNIITDIDLNQTKFDLDYKVSYSKWCAPIFDRANKTVELFKNNILK